MKWSCRDDSCSGCSNKGGPANGCYWPDNMQGTCSWYWSSSPVEDYDSFAWYVLFSSGRVFYFVRRQQLHTRSLCPVVAFSDRRIVDDLIIRAFGYFA